MDSLRRSYGRYIWNRIDIGCSDAEVFRLDDADMPCLYMKTVPRHSDSAADLVAEGERLVWLSKRNIPVPEIIESDADGERVWLVTRAVEGRTAADVWSPAQQLSIVDALADLAKALHALPVAECPFDRSLSITIPEAERRATEGLVDLEDLDEPRAGWTTERLVAELHRTRPKHEDRVVCHGDFCLPNVLLDSGGMAIAGVIDVGRLGIADRHTDLALATRSLDGQDSGQYGPRHAARFLARYGADGTDERFAFYCLLDEFY